jgi:glutamate-1-semialdehyde 2,1-aminomutase
MAESIRQTYVRRSPRSAALQSRFQHVFPTGVSHDMRAADPFPLVIARGQGARKWDIDDNEYIDYGLGSASL